MYRVTTKQGTVRNPYLIATMLMSSQYTWAQEEQDAL